MSRHQFRTENVKTHRLAKLNMAFFKITKFDKTGELSNSKTVVDHNALTSKSNLYLLCVAVCANFQFIYHENEIDVLEHENENTFCFWLMYSNSSTSLDIQHSIHIHSLFLDKSLSSQSQR